MKKMKFTKVAALGIAAVISLPAFTVAASAERTIADVFENIDRKTVLYADNHKDYYIVYYSTSTKLYYDNRSAAVSASPNANYVEAYYSLYMAADLNKGKGKVYKLVEDDDSSSSSSSSSTNGSSSTYKYIVYYSSSTKLYYDKYETAVAASPNSDYVRAYKSNYMAATLNKGNGRVGPRVYDINGESTKSTGKTSTNSENGVTIGKSRGWNAVIRTINSAKSGSSYTVNMNEESEIPRSVLKALKDNDVTVSFKYSNGVIISINGDDITSTTAFSPVVKTNVKGVPSSLKDKSVKSNKGVASSQIYINGEDFGCTASVTVKLSSKRKGFTAKLYYYDKDNAKLTFISKSTIDSKGQCEFDNVDCGGYYLIVISE